MCTPYRYCTSTVTRVSRTRTCAGIGIHRGVWLNGALCAGVFAARVRIARTAGGALVRGSETRETGEAKVAHVGLLVAVVRRVDHEHRHAARTLRRHSRHGVLCWQTRRRGARWRQVAACEVIGYEPMNYEHAQTRTSKTCLLSFCPVLLFFYWLASFDSHRIFVQFLLAPVLLRLLTTVPTSYLYQ